MNQDYTNSGIYSNLTDLGISIDSNLNATISDSSALTTAISTHFSDVTALLDSLMTTMSDRVSVYSGTEGYANKSIETADSNIKTLSDRISSINERLERREEYLVKYYAQYQAQMESYMNQSSLNTALYG
jgi:flagellar capping protein FliD